MYAFGGLRFAICGQMPEAGTEDLLPRFLARGQGTADVRISVQTGEILPPPQDARLLHDSYSLRVVSHAGMRYAYFREFAQPHACLSFAEATPNERSLTVCTSRIRFTEQVLLSCLMLEELFLRCGGALLHASWIRTPQGAILFTAPCGTGKSTQAALWEAARGSEIVNGDKAALYFAGDTLRAAGLPLAGTSGICKNQEDAVRAIVLLSQAKQNRVERLRGRAAVSALLSQLYVQRWDCACVSAAAEFAASAVARTPMYHLACLPEISAVCALEKALMGE